MNTLTTTPVRTFAWITTTDRDDVRHYVLPTGQIVTKDGAGRNAWSVYYADGSHAYGPTMGEMKSWAEMDVLTVERDTERAAMASEAGRLTTPDAGDDDALGSWSSMATGTPSVRPTGAPVVDWEAVLAMGAREQEAALVKITGIRADADLHGNVTGAEGRRERAYDYTEPTTATAIDAHVHARGVEVVSSVRDAVRRAAHVIPDGPDAMRTALTLSALMHPVITTTGRAPMDSRPVAVEVEDVVSAAGKIVVTRLARRLTGEDTLTTATRVAVAEAVEVAVGHLADGALDHLDSRDRDATTDTLTHRLLAVHDGRVVALMDEHVTYVTSDPGSDDTAESGWSVPATRADARARRADARPFGPYYARREPVAPAPLPVVTMGPHRAPRTARVTPRMIGSHVSRYVAATATAMTRGMGTGQGMGVDAYGNVSRDALRRVSLSDGFTFSRERLSGPLTGGSWVDGPARATTGTSTARAARTERVAVVKVATSKRDALRARLAR